MEISRYMRLEELSSKMINEIQKLANVSITHGSQIKELFKMASNSVSKLELLAAVATTRYHQLSSTIQDDIIESKSDSNPNFLGNNKTILTLQNQVTLLEKELFEQSKRYSSDIFKVERELSSTRKNFQDYMMQMENRLSSLEGSDKRNSLLCREDTRNVNDGLDSLAVVSKAGEIDTMNGLPTSPSLATEIESTSSSHDSIVQSEAQISQTIVSNVPHRPLSGKLSTAISIRRKSLESKQQGTLFTPPSSVSDIHSEIAVFDPSLNAMSNNLLSSKSSSRSNSNTRIETVEISGNATHDNTAQDSMVHGEKQLDLRSNDAVTSPISLVLPNKLAVDTNMPNNNVIRSETDVVATPKNQNNISIQASSMTSSTFEIVRQSTEMVSPNIMSNDNVITTDSDIVQSNSNNNALILSFHDQLNRQQDRFNELERKILVLEAASGGIAHRLDNSISQVDQMQSVLKVLDNEHDTLYRSYLNIVQQMDSLETTLFSSMDHLANAVDNCYQSIGRQEKRLTECSDLAMTLQNGIRWLSQGSKIFEAPGSASENPSLIMPSYGIGQRIPELLDYPELMQENGSSIDVDTLMKQLRNYGLLYKDMVSQVQSMEDKYNALVESKLDYNSMAPKSGGVISRGGNESSRPSRATVIVPTTGSIIPHDNNRPDEMNKIPSSIMNAPSSTVSSRPPSSAAMTIPPSLRATTIVTNGTIGHELSETNPNRAAISDSLSNIISQDFISLEVPLKSGGTHGFVDSNPVEAETTDNVMIHKQFDDLKHEMEELRSVVSRMAERNLGLPVQSDPNSAPLSKTIAKSIKEGSKRSLFDDSDFNESGVIDSTVNSRIQQLPKIDIGSQILDEDGSTASIDAPSSTILSSRKWNSNQSGLMNGHHLSREPYVPYVPSSLQGTLNSDRLMAVEDPQKENLGWMVSSGLQRMGEGPTPPISSSISSSHGTSSKIRSMIAKHRPHFHDNDEQDMLTSKSHTKPQSSLGISRDNDPPFPVPIDTKSNAMWSRLYSAEDSQIKRNSSLQSRYSTNEELRSPLEIQGSSNGDHDNITVLRNVESVSISGGADGVATKHSKSNKRGGSKVALVCKSIEATLLDPTLFLPK